MNCRTPHLTDDQLKYAFVAAFNQILGNKERYIADYKPIIAMLTDTTELDNQIAKLTEEQEELYTLVKNCIDEKARHGANEALVARHNKLIGRYDAIKQRLDDIESEIQSRQIKRAKIEAFLAELKFQGDIITEFDEKLWQRTAERIIVYRESEVVVEFKDGTQIKVSAIGK